MPNAIPLNRLLNRIVANGTIIVFALKNQTRAIFFSNHIGALIARASGGGS
jgi:hypothetical protein